MRLQDILAFNSRDRANRHAVDDVKEKHIAGFVVFASREFLSVIHASSRNVRVKEFRLHRHWMW